ncbi:MAG: glycosyltransferase family 9 protein [Candidatus Omnitrophota bacterium]|nr:glycosyltransferase family 9 protein [Candidatus Omnitrophota bacterium]
MRVSDSGIPDKTVFPRYVFKRWEKRFAAFLFDVLGTVLWWPLRLLGRAPKTNVRRILIIRIDHLGDVIMTRPAMRLLAAMFPDARLDLLTSHEASELLRTDEAISEVIPFATNWFSRTGSWGAVLSCAHKVCADLRSRRYDLAVDFRGDVRNIILMAAAGIPERWGYAQTGGGFLLTRRMPYAARLHQVSLNARLVDERAEVGERPLPFRYSSAAKEAFWRRWSRRLADRRPRIVVHAEAGYPSKRWPAGRYSALIEGCLAENLGEIILIGTEQEQPALAVSKGWGDKVHDLRGRTTLAELPILFDGADVYVGNDSGPAHMAAAQGMAVVSIFSAVNDAPRWRPWTNRLHLVTRKVHCSPCESRVCPLGHHECMSTIQVEEVMDEIRAVLNAISGREVEKTWNTK